LLEALERRRIVQELRCRLDAAHLCTRFRDADQHVALLRGKAFDGVHEVRHEVGTPLVLVHDFGPCRLDAFVLRLHRVVAAPGHQQQRQ
jgi:hypothetical protein